MTTATVNDTQGDSDLKGKEFDEVCELIRKDDVAGSVNKRPDGGGAGRWAFCFSESDEPGNGTRPESMWYSVQPSA